MLAANPGKLVVLMASLTWCRPCKTFQTTYEVRGSCWCICLSPLRLRLLALHRAQQQSQPACTGATWCVSSRLPVPQKAAQHYNDAIFVKFYGGEGRGRGPGAGSARGGRGMWLWAPLPLALAPPTVFSRKQG